MKKIEFLRSHHPQFFYNSYSYELRGKDLHIAFEFTAPPKVKFRPTLVIHGLTKGDIKRVGKQALDNLVFNLGIIEMFSYWKSTASPEIVVRAGSLNRGQISWWKNLLIKGMGQYFYENRIDFTDPNFVRIRSQGKDGLSPYKKALTGKTLVPLGGGKDGSVTWELLKGADYDITAFALNPTQTHKQIFRVGKIVKPITITRTIDPALLSLNKKGYLNGHTPFSAYLAFLTVITAVLFDYKYIALSNERSSNEGNVRYLGKSVNHQYSKTYEFEKNFREYSKEYLATNVEYFSFLRPLYELQIAKLFANYPQYYYVFLSCNEAHKTDSGTKKGEGKWCCNCSKCLFVYLALSPFLDEQELKSIFGQNLLKSKNLAPVLDELIGKKKFKPFECVGTIEESKAALTRKGLEKILGSWNTEHFLPKDLTTILKDAIIKES